MITKTGTRVRVEAHFNGRATVPVAFWSVDGVLLAPIDSGKLEQVSERQRLVQPLADEADRTEALLLLNAAAIEWVRDRETVVPAVPDTKPPLGADPSPWGRPVEGVELLDDLATWFSKYIVLPPGAAETAALWTAVTWLREEISFAAVLALLSPTKRCGKSFFLDLLGRVAYRPVASSGTGITTAVVFRLNDARHVTLLIDEAEKLSGRHADRELVGMLNVGYRKGAQVQRCVEQPGGGYRIDSFDAFGFRALAAIGTLWDTILDRSIVVTLARKSRSVAVARFAERPIAAQGGELARRLARWAADQRGQVAEAIEAVPRPDWLSDRGCDNWSALFAVAAVAGGGWPERALTAAHALQTTPDQDEDAGERLVRDLARVFPVGTPVLKSGEVVKVLNELDDAPWGDYRHGDGLSTHQLAKLLRAFGVRPRQDRDGPAVIRGYWRMDLDPVFTRYGCTTLDGETGTAVSPSKSTPRTSVPVVPLRAERGVRETDSEAAAERAALQEPGA